MFSVHRNPKNPIITPDASSPWRDYEAFNGSPVFVDGKDGQELNLIYRASSKPKKFAEGNFILSTVGRAVLGKKGQFIDNIQLISPEESWERFGCEDPRVTKIGDTYYIFYTALSAYPFHADGIKVAVAMSKDMKTITERHLVTPFNAKAMSLFPEKINGKYTVIFAAHTDQPPTKISIAQFDRIEDLWNEKAWFAWHEKINDQILDIPKKDGDHLEIGAAPIKTRYGWLLVYSHIQNYHSTDPIFGVEAVLLDLKNPKKVIAKTKGPFMVPETDYEKNGVVKNITFPSGTLIVDRKLHVYYGGADTVCASAEMSLEALLSSMEYFDLSERPLSFSVYKKKHVLQRVGKKPLLEPVKGSVWESRAVFNPSAVAIDDQVHVVYRAMSGDNTSYIGYASSHDAVTIDYRSPEPIYGPHMAFENKNIPNANSGCEDPRLTIIGKKIFMAYTAFNGTDTPHIALTSIDINDFKNRFWKWTEPYLISADGVDDKDGALMSEKVKGKYALIHRVNRKVCIDYSETLKFENRNKFENRQILEARPGMWDTQKVGINTVPIVTEKGLLTLYHGIDVDGVYRVGAILLDNQNPEKVLARTAMPILEPVMSYEKKGQINNVVFPCGMVLRTNKSKKIVYVYYGGADSVVGVAEIALENMLELFD